MVDDRKEPTELTPQGLEVPIPKRSDFMRNMEKLAKPERDDEKVEDEDQRSDDGR